MERSERGTESRQRQGKSAVKGGENVGRRSDAVFVKTKPREREAETECEMGERAPSLRRERGTRGAPRRQRQDKSAVKREREEERERRTWSPGGDAQESRSQRKD